jgi:hypothetical protein
MCCGCIDEERKKSMRYKAVWKTHRLYISRIEVLEMIRSPTPRFNQACHLRCVWDLLRSICHRFAILRNELVAVHSHSIAVMYTLDG